MSNFLSKFKKLNYKELYETELNNRKLYEQRYKELKDENIELQKKTGLANLRVKYNKALDKIAFLKEDRAKLYIQLEDARNELDVLKSKQKPKMAHKRGNGNVQINKK